MIQLSTVGLFSTTSLKHAAYFFRSCFFVKYISAINERASKYELKSVKIQNALTFDPAQ